MLPALRHALCRHPRSLPAKYRFASGRIGPQGVFRREPNTLKLKTYDLARDGRRGPGTLMPGAGLEPSRACAQRLFRADPAPLASDVACVQEALEASTAQPDLAAGDRD